MAAWRGGVAWWCGVAVVRGLNLPPMHWDVGLSLNPQPLRSPPIALAKTNSQRDAAPLPPLPSRPPSATHCCRYC